MSHCICAYVCDECVHDGISSPMFPGQGVDPMEYDIEEEYEARIDSQALARLEPDVRSKIDPSFLGKIAQANPRVLAEVGHSPPHNTHTHTHTHNCAITHCHKTHTPPHNITTNVSHTHAPTTVTYHTMSHTTTSPQMYLVLSSLVSSSVYIASSITCNTESDPHWVWLRIWDRD